MRLIDADALHEDFMNDLFCLKFSSALQGTPRSDIDISNVLERIEDFPTIEAEPVKHGRWIDDRTSVICGHCNAEYSDEIFMMGDNVNYCPNCGAKMDKPAIIR